MNIDDVMTEPFVAVARAKGASRSWALRKHVAKNALLPTPQKSLPSCSPQLTPLPVRKASTALSSSAHMEATTCQPFGMKNALVSSARTMACSGVSS